MATLTDPNQDKKYNPGERQYHEDFDRPADDLENIPFADEASPAEEAAIDRAKAAAREAEEQATKTAPIGEKAKSLAAQEARPSSNLPSIKPKGMGFKGKGALGTFKKIRFALAGVGIVTSITGLVVAGVMGAFVSMKELALEFWSKNHYSAYSRRVKQLDKRLFQVPDENCTGIKCRLKQGISDKEIDKYRKAGLNPEVGEKGGKKYIISFTFTDESGKEVKVNQANFKATYASSPKFLGMVSVVSKPKALVYRGTHALKKYAHFRVDRKNVPKDAKEHRRYIYGGGKQQVAVKPAGDAEDEKTPTAENLSELDETISEAADKQIADLEANDYNSPPDIRPDVNNLDLDLDKAAAVGEETIKGAAGGALFGVFNYLEKACTGYEIIRIVTFGAKLWQARSLVIYAMLFMTAADKLKAGDIPYTELAFMAGLLMKPSREKGPDYGKTAANSVLYSMVVGGGKVSSKTGLARFSNGTPFLRFLQATKSYFEAAGANKTTCKHVKSWYGQAGLAIAGILTSIATLGAGAIAGIAQGAIVGAIIGVMAGYAIPLLIQMAAGTSAPDPDDPGGGFAAGNAAGAGISKFASELGKGGERPLTKDEAPQVARETAEEMARLKAADHHDENPFSINNPDSITNRLALVMAPYFFAPTAQSNYQNIVTLATSPLTIVGNSVNQLFFSKVSALETNYGGKFCADEDYADMNLLTDAYCTPVYGEQEAVLESPKYEPDNVVNFMVDNGHVDPETGAPKSEEYQKFLRSCVDGDAPLTPDGGGAELGEDIDTRDCLKGDKTGTATTNARLAQANTGDATLAQAAPAGSGDAKFTMFRMYVMDTNILDGIQKSADDTLGAGGAEGSAPATSGAPLNPGAFTWPIHPSGSSRISSCMNLTDPSYRQHAGLDIAAPLGTPIVAVADGTVVFEGKSVGGFGYYVAIKHANGAITGYGHNQSNEVKQGDVVKQGQPIATVGSRGQSTGPHVHMNYIPDGSNHFTSPSSIAFNPLFNNLMPKPADVDDTAGCLSPQKLKAR